MDMESIVLGTIPHLVQMLCQSVYENGGHKNTEGFTKPAAAFDFSSPFKIPNQSGRDLLERLDEEFEVIKIACDYAVRAVEFYTGQMMSKIRAHRNELRPIYRLPIEILSLVFEFTEGCAKNSLRLLPRRAPLTLSQVSKQWRELAFNTPRLWTKIDAMNGRISDVFIARSKRASLNIELARPPKDPTLPNIVLDCFVWYCHETFWDFIRPLLPHIHRWESLALEELTYDDAGAYLVHSAPRLERLTMRNFDGRFGHTLPDTFLGGCTPQLRDLEVCNVKLPLTSPIYTGLRRLHLENNIYDISTIRHLLVVLAACPLLEDLAILNEFFCGLADSNSRKPHTPVFLNHLRRMDACTEGRTDIHDIISALVVPPSLYLSMSLAYRGLAHGLTLRDALPTSYPNIALIDTLALEIHSSTANFHLVGENAGRNQTLLDIRCDYRTDSNLLTLIECPSSFVDLLALTPSLRLCPLLDTLHLGDVMIESALPLLGSGNLIEAVRSRSDEGHTFDSRARLSHLSVSNCAGMSERTASELEKYVENFTWD
ncbi:hypothetical protein BOTBODRAFT_266365 [Botryobasidium botryosum FD-172 SS1]|uniref:F-box domain-containing protein n=1 Tax=Botryobasidium botryosum (strain FD-172 SS1) TaxID=930990 RepID=A0A067MMT9_BOTB1|nr:hypothetical protein BOTBODRAFT_266365 [Botryobasidium botryosum FD-172 SS1]